jgi:rhamnosyltransferase
LISVVIPTLNAAESIGTLLSSLKQQSVDTELIIIDSASTDKTVPIAQSLGAKIIQIRREDFDHGGTRNRAAREATGDILVFMTQDALPADKFVVERLTDALKGPGVAASYARQIARADASPPEAFVRAFNYPSEPLVKTIAQIPMLGFKTFFFSNVCSSIRKDVFNELGGFPEGVIMDEDMLFAARAINNDYSIVYVPEASVFHSHQYDWFGQFRRYFDIGVSFRGHGNLLRVGTMGGEGMRFVREELQFLWKNNARFWIPYVLIELVCRYAGYAMGYRYPYVPRFLRRLMSLHRNYWDKDNPAEGVKDQDCKRRLVNSDIAVTMC